MALYQGHFITDARPVLTEAEAALRATSTEGLLRAAYTLTHHLHEADEVRLHATSRALRQAQEDRCDDLRAQRDQITAEVLRRAGA